MSKDVLRMETYAMKRGNDQPTPAKTTSLIAICARKFFNFMGFAGVVFIIYGLVSEVTKNPWPLLEQWMNFLSSLLTLFGTVLTAGTVYIWSRQPHPPERFSLYVSAPVVIAGAVAAIVFLLWKQQLPTAVVNGFALLAMAGALFRIQPHTAE